MPTKITQTELSQMWNSQSITADEKAHLLYELNKQHMTLTMKQILVLLRSSVRENDIKDVQLFKSILERNIKDEPILQMNEEVKEAMKMAEEFIETFVIESSRPTDPSEELPY